MKTVLLILMALIFSKCMTSNQESKNYLGNDVRLFRDTPVWDIANAIADEDSKKVKQLVMNTSKNVLNYQEKKFGQSLLIWSVYSGYYKGFKILIDSGVDINIKAYDSTQAINWAANVYETSDYLKELIKRKANVNYIANNNEAIYLRTPLIAAANSSFENTKILVEAGADVNYSYSEKGYHASPLYSAFLRGNIDVIRYLIMVAKVDPKRCLETKFDGEDLFAVDLLRTLTFDIGSKEYKKKMEVVDFLMKQGVNYRKTPIPLHFYKLYDKSYLEKY